MQNILAKKSTPGRRAAKRDRAARIGEFEQMVLGVFRIIWTWAKQLGASAKELMGTNAGQLVLIGLVLVLLIGSGFVETLVDGWLGQ